MAGREYGIRLTVIGSDTLLFLDRLTSRDERGRRGHEVVAAAHAPPIPTGHQLAFGVCRARKQLDSRIVAVVRSEDTPFYTSVAAAWRADVTTSRFEPIPVAGIDCENEGWGE
ncbi:MAG TPA: hypothetical protein VF771_07795 [Longimicrobiaceae bacterium]